MSHNIPYSTDTVRINDELIPGNSVANDPVEFDIAPAWGADLARVKSILVACTGLASDSWSAEEQDSVIKAFETGGSAFVNTVTAVRGLKLPAAMAVRAGIQPAIQAGVAAAALVPVTSGVQFGQICGHSSLIGITLQVALAIVDLSRQQRIDARFFVQPSGSGGPATMAAQTTSAGSARRTPRRRVTAAVQGQAVTEPSGISDQNQSQASSKGSTGR